METVQGARSDKKGGLLHCAKLCCYAHHSMQQRLAALNCNEDQAESPMNESR